MSAVRPYRPTDTAVLARICVLTGDDGGDATGVFDDDLLPELFLLPYLERHPDLAFVLADEADVPIGYIVGTDDTAAFEAWFAGSWWPERGARRWPRPAAVRTRSDAMVAYGYSRGQGGSDDGGAPAGDPAHLHIDLLPQAQGGGWGRVLIGALADALRARGCEGLHASASRSNPGALAFYPRVGFVPAGGDDDTATFGLALS